MGHGYTTRLPTWHLRYNQDPRHIWVRNLLASLANPGMPLAEQAADKGVWKGRVKGEPGKFA